MKFELYRNENKDIEYEILSIENVLELVKISDKLEDVGFVVNYCVILNKGVIENGIKDESVNDIYDMFEVGCVVVEFKRSEVLCMVVYCLYGRVFDDRIVIV